MKRKLILPLLFAIMVVPAFSQKANVVKVNLLSPIFKTGNFAYERVINENLGLQLRGYFASFKLGDQPINGYGIIPEARFYVASDKDAPEGFFVAPFLLYSSLGLETDVVDPDRIEPTYTAKGSLNNVGGGLVVGTQKVFSDIVTFEAFIGLKYTAGSVSVDGPGAEDDFDTDRLGGFLPRGGITLGFLF